MQTKTPWSTGKATQENTIHGFLITTGGIAAGMIQGNNFYITLPSNANSNLLLINSKSSYRVVLQHKLI